MSNINLLPWREEQAAVRTKRLIAGTVVLWLFAGALVGGAWMYVDNLIKEQNARNSFLRGEIASLEDEIREIEDLKKQRESLLNRMRVIQELQQTRTDLVRILDELVKITPEGVYFTRLQLRDKKVDIDGRAQTNARVSALMRAFEASNWFHGPKLIVVNVTRSGEQQISNFKLTIAKAGLDKKETEG